MYYDTTLRAWIRDFRDGPSFPNAEPISREEVARLLYASIPSVIDWEYLVETGKERPRQITIRRKNEESLVPDPTPYYLVTRKAWFRDVSDGSPIPHAEEISRDEVVSLSRFAESAARVLKWEYSFHDGSGLPYYVVRRRRWFPNKEEALLQSAQVVLSREDVAQLFNTSVGDVLELEDILHDEDECEMRRFQAKIQSEREAKVESQRQEHLLWVVLGLAMLFAIIFGLLMRNARF